MSEKWWPSKWGADDELGGANYLSEKRTKLAAKLIKKLPKSKCFNSILYPGERKNKTYKKNLNKDISIPSKILKEMNELNAI